MIFCCYFMLYFSSNCVLYLFCSVNWFDYSVCFVAFPTNICEHPILLHCAIIQILKVQGKVSCHTRVVNDTSNLVLHFSKFVAFNRNVLVKVYNCVIMKSSLDNSGCNFTSIRIAYKR